MPRTTSTAPGISVPMIRPPLASPATPGASRGHPDAGPVADHDDDRGPDAAGRQVRVDHVGERAGDERRAGSGSRRSSSRTGTRPRGSPSASRSLADPVVDAALPARRQLGRDQRGRQQEHDRRDDVQEDAPARRRPWSVRRAGWRPNSWSSGRARSTRCKRRLEAWRLGRARGADGAAEEPAVLIRTPRPDIAVRGLAVPVRTQPSTACSSRVHLQENHLDAAPGTHDD